MKTTEKIEQAVKKFLLDTAITVILKVEKEIRKPNVEKAVKNKDNEAI
jgi:hypothetical protein